MLLHVLRALACVLVLIAAPASAALDPSVVVQLGAEDSDVRVDAIRKLVATEDPRVIEILRALDGDALALIDGGKRAVIAADGKLTDAVTGQPAGTTPANLETIVINNRIRGEIGAALAALRLGSSDRAERLAAARELQGSDNEDALPIIERAMAKETDPEIQSILTLAGASLALKSSEPDLRARAARTLAASSDPQVRQLLATMLTKQKDGTYIEPDEKV
ncbi:MAG: urea ABC transporter permease subunit UrtB, partial [Betaproteobacteria bacterium]